MNHGQTHTEWYQTVKVCVYFREDYCLKFSEVWTNSMKFETKGFPRKILSVAKTTTIRKWELNTCRNFVNLRTGDSFVDRCRRKIYTIWKYHQNIQQNIYNEYVTICRVFRRWCTQSSFLAFVGSFPVDPELFWEIWWRQWMKVCVFVEMVVWV